MLEIKMRRLKVWTDTLKQGDTFLYQRKLYMVCEIGGVLENICLNDSTQVPFAHVKVELVDYVLTRL